MVKVCISIFCGILLTAGLSASMATDVPVAAQPPVRGHKPSSKLRGLQQRKNEAGQTVRELKAYELIDDPSFPLERCQGDCDTDDHCEPGLVCYERNKDDPIPGCTGIDGSRSDYCVDPSDIGGATTATVAATTTKNGAGPTKEYEILSNKPSGGYGECQGDCDDDDDCRGDLICYDREPNTSVPGCLGTPSSRTDFCAPPGLEGVTRKPVETTTTTRATTRGNFNGGGGNTPPNEYLGLRLFWDEGFYWQETCDETFWCIGCRGGSCGTGEKMFIDDCRPSEWRRRFKKFKFDMVVGGDFLIRLENSNKCWERDNNDITLETCNSNNDKQLWYKKNGGLGVGEKFELSQRRISDKCVTQRHHPKYDEEVEIEPCATARKGDTSYWEWYM